MSKRISAIALALGLAATIGLVGCNGGSASFTQLLGDASAEVNSLDGTVEGDFDLPYTSIAMDVELESGTIDVEIVDIMITHEEDGPDDAIEMGTISESTGLANGDRTIFTDDDGAIRVRITSDNGATGTLKFSDAG